MPSKSILLHTAFYILQYGLIFLIYYFIFRLLVLMWKDLKIDLPLKNKQARLMVLASGSMAMKSFYTIGCGLSIGRNTDNQISIDDPFISHYHARIEKRNDQYHLIDLNSMNHTYLNGSLLQGESCLFPGDEIKIGMATFKFER